MIFVPDIIGDIVDSIRETGSYSGVVDNGDGTFTILSVNSLKDGDWVEIDGNDYEVLSATTTQFTVSSSIDLTTTSSYKALAPYYLYGHRLDMANRLLEKDKDDVFKYQKYPLIALRLPLQQEIQQDSMNKASLNLAIMAFTSVNYPSEERYEKVIKPILYPIYQQFLLALRDSSYISNVGNIEHNRIDRLFWGIEQREGNVKYIFNDPLDAIELTDLKLNILDFNC